ncbi:uncharacterized protein LOC125372522 [Haliotis rufescens]|uniref:uncharacterized protein LOC125372522 n=1 Tax=Haliotis rufescens TaxID=6454 RepID=UPI00201E9ACA|nr:uncharacterized protein LOC125372522 [Haliotis rufescens]
MNSRYPLRNIPVRGQDYVNPALAHVMDLLNTWLPPTPVTSPDEMVIQQRSRRRSPTKQPSKSPATVFCTDFQSFDSPPRDRLMTTPEAGDTPLRHAGVAGIRKRLLMSPPSDTTALTKTLAPPYKKTRKRESAQREMSDSLRQELSALSNQQLIQVISDIANRYSLQKEVRSTLPTPDVSPLVRNLEFFCRNILRSLPTSRLMKDAGCYHRARTHIDNFKQACISQGRQLQQCRAWQALWDYVRAAWDVVDKLPVWCHGNQNKARFACQRSLATMVKMVAKSGGLPQSDLTQLLKWCKERQGDCSALAVCAQMLEQT